MPTHDYVIDNQTAPNFRADLNSALQAIVSNNSSTSAPTVTYANMIWYDTTNKLLRMRTEADDAWITLGTLDQVANTFAVSGIASATLASGTANSTTFLRGDRTWQAINVTPTTAQVLSATAGASAGAVGTYSLMVLATGGALAAGATTAGSNLRFSTTGPDIIGGAPSGTWRNMGPPINSATTPNTGKTTVFLRVS